MLWKQLKYRQRFRLRRFKRTRVAANETLFRLLINTLQEGERTEPYCRDDYV